MNRSFLFPVAIGASASAEASPADDLLAQVDAAAARGTDAHLVLAIQAVDPKGVASARTLEIWQKGNDKRLVRFTEPARLAGTALLVPDGQTVYLYLPAYGRARRVVGEARGDAFLGTDFSLEDLARIRWAEEYTPELIGTSALRLRPKEGVKAASAWIDLEVRPQDHLPATVAHFRADGTMIRKITFSDVRDIQGRPLAHSVRVEDVASGRRTEATIQSAKLDSGLSDDLFTLSQLQR
jgi:outer membrane lipoprotein-sorting protein